ncbi:hypothetical protein RclHR1_14970003 [Rhizophagus clarus]|uniref:BTB domain-containing protein n=1 Tax=Rhizophagus clarus TaxID=94130 RepID=A0A2Z6QDZ2_9GLOM|nr:hypothetical protein RclHR1_14970003 [Rhizophagus clarus]
MSTQFFSKLSQNYIEILEDNEYYDVTIEVGEDPNVKIFRAHMIILCHRSPFFRRALASKKKNDNNILAHIRLSNISPEIFQIILRYLYGGVFSSDGQDTLDFFKVLIAADELLLQELVDYLQKYLIENKAEWMEQHFELTHRTSFQSNNLSDLQLFCTEFMAKFPDKIFKSLDFTSLPEKSLISLIKRDDLQMKEIEVWEHVLKWGLAQNQTLIPDSDTWTDDDFKMIENTLQHCLPFIRFFSLSSKEFLHKIRPYKKLFKQQLYEKLLNSYMDPDNEPDENSNSKFSYLRELYLPFKFELLLRGSRDGFGSKKFHQLCNDRPNTITFVKVKGTGEILGGHNPSIWKSSGGWDHSYYSFIFSFKSKDEIKDSTLSRVKNMDKALHFSDRSGPSFGGTDLKLSISGFGVPGVTCKQTYYEKRIIDTEEYFYIEDYEVFQINKN